MLMIHLFSIFTFKTRCAHVLRPPNHADTDKYTLTITYNKYMRTSFLGSKRRCDFYSMSSDMHNDINLFQERQHMYTA